MVASVFLDDFVAHGLTDNDFARLSEAFETVGRKITQWPRPSEIIGALPKREKEDLALENPVTREQAKANLAIIREMLRGKVVDLGR